MARDELTEEERQEMARVLRQLIAGDGYPLSPRVRRWKAMLGKLDPPATSPPVPYPAPKPSGEPSLLYRKLKGGGQRGWPDRSDLASGAVGLRREHFGMRSADACDRLRRVLGKADLRIGA